MNSATDPFRLGPTPEWFPHAVDPVQDLILFVRRSEAELKAASFLDDRSLTPASARRLLSWRQLNQALPSGRRDAQYIFHIGHVGSTLVSRLLGELRDVLALREPLALRTFYDVALLQGQPDCPWDPASLDARFEVLALLLSRTFRPDQRALIKATSFTSEIADRLVPTGSRALLMYVSAQSYIENILAGDASRQELHRLAGTRLVRLSRRLGEPPASLWELDEGERAALAWACEMSSIQQASIRLPQTRWCDFDRFLADPADELRSIGAFFSHPLDDAAAAELCSGPLMTRYSKALEHPYSPQLRQEVLANSRRRNQVAIKRAMDWLQRMGERYEPIAETLERAG